MDSMPSSVISKFQSYSAQGILLVKQKGVSHLPQNKRERKGMCTGPSSSGKALRSVGLL